MLSYFPNVKISSIEIYKFDRAEKGASIIKEKFPKRLQIIWQDSNILYKEVFSKKVTLPLDKYDTAFIDGGHYPDIVNNDIKLSKLLGIKNFIFDDGECPGIFPAIQKHSDLKLIRKYPYIPLKKINGKYFVKKIKGGQLLYIITKLNVESLIPCLIPKIQRVKKPQFLGRAKGFELSTSTLARLCVELLILVFTIC